MDIFFVSDQHFSHSNILKFTTSNGEKLRPEFSSIEEMDVELINRHNKVIDQYQKIYFLGDICFNLNRYHSIMPRLNGKKRLILGNHDKFNMYEYLKYFEKIQESWQPVRNILFTHRPVYLGDNNDRIIYNVHGHIHRGQLEDKRYLNISVEETDYTPIHFDQIIERLKAKGNKIDGRV